MSLSRWHNTRNTAPRVEINVVPLVDVSLVLLVIFMLTATFYRSAGFNVHLPTSSMTRIPRQARQELVIGVTAQGKFLWHGAEVTDANLAAALQQYAARYGSNERVTIQGDERATHGRVVKAMNLADRAHFTQLRIATLQEVTQREQRH